jgi:hypothetical protein
MKHQSGSNFITTLEPSNITILSTPVACYKREMLIFLWLQLSDNIRELSSLKKWLIPLDVISLIIFVTEHLGRVISIRTRYYLLRFVLLFCFVCQMRRIFSHTQSKGKIFILCADWNYRTINVTYFLKYFQLDGATTPQCSCNIRILQKKSFTLGILKIWQFSWVGERGLGSQREWEKKD